MRLTRGFLFVGLAALALLACDRGGAQDESSSDDPMLEALADTLLPRLERLSRLQALRPVELERRTTAQVREYVDSQLEEELPAPELEGIRNTYALLGLVPDSLDLHALLLDLYAEQIVGYYDPTEQKLFVVEGVGADAVMPVLAHELVHALQDQHTNLDSLIARERGNDRQSAAQAAIEGHATLVMFSLLAEDASRSQVDPAVLPNPADQLRTGLEAETSDFPVFRTAPRILRETLLFPYVAGSRFVQELWRSQPEAERSAPIGAFLPQSTEQVLNPIGRFVEARDEPTDLLLGDVPATNGAGNSAAPDRWTTEYENGLGRLEAGLFLEEHLGMGADSAAEGWDGDRFRLLRSPSGQRALVWYSIWDDDASADRFARAVREILGTKLQHAGSVTRVPIDGRPGVRVTLAPRGMAAEVAAPAVRIAH